MLAIDIHILIQIILEIDLTSLIYHLIWARDITHRQSQLHHCHWVEMLSRLTRITFQLYTHIICSVMEVELNNGHDMEKSSGLNVPIICSSIRLALQQSGLDTQHFNRGIPSQITLIRLRFAASC
jgi:hypothetical protein